MNVILTRYYQDECTLGTLRIVGKKHNPIYTLENPWLENRPFISCIPQGTYKVLPYSSPRFPDVWELQNVIDRSKILIHAGNVEKDTSGCILVGTEAVYWDDEKGLAKSRKSLNLMRYLLDDEFELEIINLF